MNKKTLYLECSSGISGDMTVAALLDLGADQQGLLEALHSLPVSGYEISIHRVQKCGIDACKFDVILTEDAGHSHAPEAAHEHYMHHMHHEHRNLFDILHILEHGALPAPVKALAEKMFRIVAEAEASVHGLPLEQVHFHEVGAVDSIVDIIAAAFCIHSLGITQVIVSPLSEGTGFVHCAHGTLPVPVPAVSKIIAAHKLPVHLTDTKGEMITPTGAAIAAALSTGCTLPETATISRIGIGAGTKDFPHANILRAMILEDTSENSPASDLQAPVWKLETNIDDSTGEQLGYTLDLLLEQGARDAFYTPIYMKKNRPAYLLTVICEESQIPAFERLLFRETTTIGIRKMPMERSTLSRRIETVLLEDIPVQFKVCTFENDTYCYPEYESVKELARVKNLSYKEALQKIQKGAEEHYGRKL